MKKNIDGKCKKIDILEEKKFKKIKN